MHPSVREKDEGPVLVSEFYRVVFFIPRTTYRNAIKINTLLEKLVRAPQTRHTISSTWICRRSVAFQIPATTSAHCSHPISLIGSQTHKTWRFRSIRFPSSLPGVLTFDTVQYRFL